MRRRFFNISGEHFDYSNYMTIEALDDEVIITMPLYMEYGIDGNGWYYIPAREPIYVKKGKLVSFRGYQIPVLGFGRINVNGKFNLKGNCLSLVFGDNAEDITSIESYENLFDSLFYYNTGLIEVDKKFLPATTLSNFCYNGMFGGCTSLTTAPELPATTLSNYCYQSMFSGCNELNYIKMLATNISATDCLYSWVSGVASTGTFVKNPAMNSLPTSVNGIPSGWTVVNNGEE